MHIAFNIDCAGFFVYMGGNTAAHAAVGAGGVDFFVGGQYGCVCGGGG